MMRPLTEIGMLGILYLLRGGQLEADSDKSTIIFGTATVSKIGGPI